jgi:uncharacterized membrane protein YdbT with pleckstrin-like domain
VLLQILRRRRAPATVEIAGRRAQHAVVARQPVDDEIVQIVLALVDVEIEAAGDQIVVVVGEPHVELDRRVAREKRRDQRREMAAAERDRRGELQRPARLRVQLGDDAACRRDRRSA